ncbi:hypothetical protein HYV49_05210 [Candidatus Pacearchaeota archaeon]|nr:hypothetical protein [Candidatus Pacearchaeota archaeon]
MKKKSNKKEQRNELSICLNGEVYLLDIKNGKRTKQPIDSRVVLQCLSSIINHATNVYLEEKENEKVGIV